MNFTFGQIFVPLAREDGSAEFAVNFSMPTFRDPVGADVFSSLYFIFTTSLYQKSGGLRVCILIHGLTNLSIALMVRYAAMAWLGCVGR